MLLIETNKVTSYEKLPRSRAYWMIKDTAVVEKIYAAEQYNFSAEDRHDLTAWFGHHFSLAGFP